MRLTLGLPLELVLLLVFILKQMNHHNVHAERNSLQYAIRLAGSPSNIKWNLQISSYKILNYIYTRHDILVFKQKSGEYDQEISQSHTADQHTEEPQSADIKNTVKVK